MPLVTVIQSTLAALRTENCEEKNRLFGRWRWQTAIYENKTENFLFVKKRITMLMLTSQQQLLHTIHMRSVVGSLFIWLLSDILLVYGCWFNVYLIWCKCVFCTVKCVQSTYSITIFVCFLGQTQWTLPACLSVCLTKSDCLVFWFWLASHLMSVHCACLFCRFDV